MPFFNCVIINLCYIPPQGFIFCLCGGWKIPNRLVSHKGAGLKGWRHSLICVWRFEKGGLVLTGLPQLYCAFTPVGRGVADVVSQFERRACLLRLPPRSHPSVTV